MILREQDNNQVYSDGQETEARMLEIAKQYPEDLSQDYIADNSCYTVNNTFSSVRRNILNWYPFKEDADILEVGAGMGALTGLLCDVGKNVVALEMSEARANVIRARYPERKNLTIECSDINRWKSKKKFDYVIFIGVLEYAAIFSDSADPFKDFMDSIVSFLKPDGKLLFAIENRFGIRYWAGASEDHLQIPFVGIEGYKKPKTARTFSKVELEDLLKRVGLEHHRFYYVFPDYKFPTLISTDEYIPDYKSLQKVSYTYGANSVLLFDEKDVYKDIVDNNKLDFFANSYLVEASKEALEEKHIVYVSGRGESKKEYRVTTTIDSNGVITKKPVHEEAIVHIQNILNNENELRNRGIRLIDTEEVEGCIESHFYRGISAQEQFETLLESNDLERVESFLNILRDNIIRSSEISKSGSNILVKAGIQNSQDPHLGRILKKGYVDMTLYNAFYENGELVFFDQEWCFEEVPADFIMYYAIKSAYSGVKVKTSLRLEDILALWHLEAFQEEFDKLEEFIWSTVLYRQTDFYGQDGYCNRFDKEMLWDNQLKRQLQEKESVIQEKEGVIQEKESVIQGKEKVLREKENIIREKEKFLCEQEQVLNNKEGHIQQLLQAERDYKNQIEAIQHSRTYRMANVFKKASVSLLPPMSLRRRLVSKIYGVLRGPQRRKLEQQYEQVKSIDEIDQSEIVQELEKVKSIEEYDEIVFPKYDQPLVSIIIPVYNQFGYTYNCLKSILQNSGVVEYEIIIGNDCSTDETQEMEQVVKNITVSTTPHNMRFLGNCNHAAELAKGKYILFLNNDTEVQENWLQPLVDLMKKDASIGMVGSKLVYADGTLQEAGGIIWGDGHAWNYGNGQNADKPEFNYVKEVDYISGAAIMIRSQLWKEIGGFDDYFAPAYCEDSDLAFEVRNRGYKVVYQPLSVVVHFEGKSNGTDLSSGVKKYQVENSRKLAEKWKDEFAKQSQTESDLFHARERSQGKKTILIIDHYVPTFDKDAGSKTTFQYIKMFIEKGYNVKFIGDNFAQMEPYTTVLQQMGVEVLYGSWYAQHIFEWIEANKEFIDFAYLNRPHITEKYIDFLKEKTDIKLIYYGHDLHFLRVQREAEMSQDMALKKEAETWKEKEFSIMKKASMSYYPSYVEEEAIHKADASIPVKAITAYVFDSFKENHKYDFEQRSGLLFVGGFGHGPNVDAVKWFVSEVWPNIKEKITGEFYIVGSNAPDEIKKLAGDGIVFKGYVSEEELQNLYQTCRMAVVPLRYGAGVKGKVVEAIYNGIPIVTTSIGAEGIIGVDAFVAVEDEADAFAEQVVDLYEDKVKLCRMAEQSQNYIKENFSVDAVWNIVKEDFE